MTQNIKILKLINGDEIIAEVLDSGAALSGDKTKVRITNPVRIVIVPTRTDPKSPTVGFAPWPEFTEEKTFTLDKSHVLVIMDPLKEFITQYSSLMSGIVLPSNKLVIPGA